MIRFKKLVDFANKPFSLSAVLGLLVTVLAIFSGNQYLKQAHFERVVEAAEVTTKGVNRLITEKFEQNKIISRAIVNHHQDRILELASGAGYPYDLNQISNEIETLFSDIRQFAILDSFGQAKVGSEGYFLGASCRNHINRALLDTQENLDEELHQCSHGSHYDVIVKLERGDQQAGFYVSFYLNYIQNMLSQFASNELKLMLVDGADFSKVMLTPTAVADDAPLEILDKEITAQVLANDPVASGDWHVIALPTKDLFTAHANKIDFASWLIFTAVFVLYLVFLYYLRIANAARFRAEQKASYSALFNAGPTVLIEKPIDGSAPLDYVSPNVKQLLGFSSEEMLSKNSFYELVYSEDLPRLKMAIDLALKKKLDSIETEFRIMRDDHRYIWVYGLIHLNIDSKDQSRKIQGYLTSINEQKLAEQQATSLIDSAPDAIVITDDQGQILQVNHMVVELFGYSVERLLGQSVNKLLPMFKSELELLDGLRNSEQVESEGVTEAGNVLTLALSLSRQKTDKGRVITIVARDVSLQKKAQEQMRLAKENAERLAESRTRFMAMISHEIRTPMNGVLGMADLLSNTSMNSQQRNYVEVIQQSGGSLISILNDVLDFSKLDEGKIQLHPEPFDLRAVIDSCFNLLTPQAKLNGVILKKQYNQTELLRLDGDAVRLRQIVLNFLGNAIKFSPNGEVSLELFFKADRGGKTQLELRFKDNGVGISKEGQKQLFQPYTQADSSLSRDFGGTGLGLSISKQLIDLMGGTVSVRSELGEGSCFKVKLPFTKVGQAVFENGHVDVSTTDKKVVPQHTYPDVPLKVLLVEDDIVNQQIAKTYLMNLGLEVDTVNNGFEAIEFWRMHHDSIDMVLMDYQMPIMDGFEASRIIRQEELVMNKPIPTVIIAFTADAYIQDQPQELMNDFMVKPLHTDEFNAKVIPWIEQIKAQKQGL
ncbi:MAG: ATP-binding protein [Pseudomonadota bacterium]|nr:ATP-binding protein [Pseudomonadota bacterium]